MSQEYPALFENSLTYVYSHLSEEKLLIKGVRYVYLIQIDGAEVFFFFFARVLIGF